MFNWLANDKLNKAVDTISKVVQMIAILVAGWWAYNQFFITVKPGLELRGDVNTELNWNKSSDPTDCQVGLVVSLDNTGLSSFDVTWIGVRGWLYTSDPKLKGPKDISVS